MSGKLPGAVCLLTAAVWVVLTALRQQRQHTALLWELAAALETMAAAIRWQGKPLPDILASLAAYPAAGPYFRRISRLLAEGTPLCRAWQQVLSAVPEADAASALELSGDEKQLTDTLLYAAQQLKRRCEQRREQQRQNAKLWCAGALSGAGLLMILLI